MVLNRSKYDQDYCVAGEPNMQERLGDQSKPAEINANGEGYCKLCEQWTKVKKNGFFHQHKASVKGHVPRNFKGSGTPARIRGRKH